MLARVLSNQSLSRSLFSRLSSDRGVEAENVRDAATDAGGNENAEVKGGFEDVKF